MLANNTYYAILYMHTRKGDAIATPAAAVGEKEVGLRSAGGRSRLGKVVTTANEPGLGGASVVLTEFGIAIGCSFGSLHISC